MREAFQQELRELSDELLLMGSMVTQALSRSVEALKARDLDTAYVIINADKAINAKRFAIEDRVLTAIATQAPMARDMRLLAAMLEISGELERIGDYAKGIGRITIYMDGGDPVKPLVDIPRMYVKVADMLRRALGAFIDGDVETARLLPAEDDEVDALYNQVNEELLQLILQNPRISEQANYLSWAAHNLERAADRVTNICERIIYTETGKFAEVDAIEFSVNS